MFVTFHTGFVEKSRVRQQSLLQGTSAAAKGVSIIGIDCAGVRRGKEHTPMDQYCADRGVFIVGNLCNLKTVVEAGGRFTACPYPMNYAELSGLPCRVVAR